jgi:hypothetical protein
MGGKNDDSDFDRLVLLPQQQSPYAATMTAEEDQQQQPQLGEARDFFLRCILIFAVLYVWIILTSVKVAYKFVHVSKQSFWQGQVLAPLGALGIMGVSMRHAVISYQRRRDYKRGCLTGIGSLVGSTLLFIWTLFW